MMPTKQELIERVAAGLRAMGIEPAGFVFKDQYQDWTYDEDTILGYPVWHSVFLTMHEDTLNIDCPFLPVFGEDFPLIGVKIAEFVKAYDNDMKSQ